MTVENCVQQEPESESVLTKDEVSIDVAVAVDVEEKPGPNLRRNSNDEPSGCEACFMCIGGCFALVLVVTLATFLILQASSEGYTPPGGKCRWWDAFCTEVPDGTDPLLHIGGWQAREIINTQFVGIPQCIPQRGVVQGEFYSDLYEYSASIVQFYITMQCSGYEGTNVTQSLNVRGGSTAIFVLDAPENMTLQDEVCNVQLWNYLPFKGYTNIPYVYAETRVYCQ